MRAQMLLALIVASIPPEMEQEYKGRRVVGIRLHSQTPTHPRFRAPIVSLDGGARQNYFIGFYTPPPCRSGFRSLFVEG